MTGLKACVLFGKPIKWLLVTTTDCQSSKTQTLWFHVHKTGLLQVRQGSRGKGHWGYLVSVRGFTTGDLLTIWDPSDFWQDLVRRSNLTCCIAKADEGCDARGTKNMNPKGNIQPNCQEKILACTFLTECQCFWTKYVSYQPWITLVEIYNATWLMLTL